MIYSKVYNGVKGSGILNDFDIACSFGGAHAFLSNAEFLSDNADEVVTVNLIEPKDDNGIPKSGPLLAHQWLTPWRKLTIMVDVNGRRLPQAQATQSGQKVGQGMGYEGLPMVILSKEYLVVPRKVFPEKDWSGLHVYMSYIIKVAAIAIIPTGTGN
ncbi:hypothetical protein H4582DRAFT_2051944 [Lactarius indigo]|nr:hypothetical protein H4582DRAFT_2051944 [Lactarius indigo]